LSSIITDDNRCERKICAKITRAKEAFNGKKKLFENPLSKELRRRC